MIASLDEVLVFENDEPCASAVEIEGSLVVTKLPTMSGMMSAKMVNSDRGTYA